MNNLVSLLGEIIAFISGDTEGIQMYQAMKFLFVNITKPLLIPSHVQPATVLLLKLSKCNTLEAFGVEKFPLRIDIKQAFFLSDYCARENGSIVCDRAQGMHHG